MKCYACGKGDTVKKSETITQEIAGRSFKTTIQSHVCRACDEATFAGDDLLRFDRQIAAELARSGAKSGEAIKYMRKAGLGMRAADLAKLLDVRAETVSDWENDKFAPTRATLAIIASMVLHRVGDDIPAKTLLETAAKPRRLPKTLRLDPADAR